MALSSSAGERTGHSSGMCSKCVEKHIGFKPSFLRDIADLVAKAGLLDDQVCTWKQRDGRARASYRCGCWVEWEDPDESEMPGPTEYGDEFEFAEEHLGKLLAESVCKKHGGRKDTYYAIGTGLEEERNMMEADAEFIPDKDVYNLPVALSRDEIESKMIRIGEVIEDRTRVVQERRVALVELKERQQQLEQELEALAVQLSSKTEVRETECEWVVVDPKRRLVKLVRMDTDEVVVPERQLSQAEFERVAQGELPLRDREEDGEE
ncbi:MAG: hypothetical protein KGL39_53870 [Patescibacteria group bacterium]|nr:hypothetical protein [Patescibacteria group bacterium]